MSDHLPECPCNHADERGCFLISAETDRCVDCICPQLRACEQRVRDESWDDGMEVGTHSALDAAREAVAALPISGGFTTPEGRFEEVLKADALAAIDGLREKP